MEVYSCTVSNLSTRWRWVVSFRRRGKGPGTLWVGGWVGPQSRSECCGEETEILTLLGIEDRLLIHPACSPWLWQFLDYPLGNVLSQLNPVYTHTHYFHKLDFNRILPSTSKNPKLPLPFRISYQNSILISHFLRAFYMPCPSNSHRYDHRNDVGRRVQILKLHTYECQPWMSRIQVKPNLNKNHKTSYRRNRKRVPCLGGQSQPIRSSTKHTQVRLNPRAGPTGLVTCKIAVFLCVQKKRWTYSFLYSQCLRYYHSSVPLKLEEAMKTFIEERNREISQAIGPVCQFGAHYLPSTCAVLSGLGVRGEKSC
jgi:hypothetical protein